jgi:PAS domain S-box-containing protein
MTGSGKPESRSSRKSGSAGKTKEELLREMEVLRARLEEAEATVAAIQSGEVDALIVFGPDGERVFALEGADYPYRVMLDVMNEGVVTLSADGGILSCNGRFVDFVNTPIEQILGQTLARFTAEQDVPKLRAFLSKASEKSGAITVALARADGTTMPVNLSASPFEVGEFAALCVIVTDLTEMLAAAQARLHLASIVETSNDAIISESLDNKILTWNAAAERIYGFSAAEALGQPISIIVPRDCINELEMIDEKMRLGQRLEGYETLRIAKSGAAIQVSLTASPLTDSNGDIIGFSVIARDITERRKVEAELDKYRHQLEEMVRQRTGELETVNARLETRILERKRAEEGLRKSEERLHLALLAAKMATWEWHVPTGEMIWDDAYYRMLGYEVGAVQPSYEAWISRVHPDDVETVEAAFRAAKNEGFRYAAEFRTCWPDGTVHWQWMLGGLDRDATGQIVRLYGVLLDISGKKGAELRIQELNDALIRHGIELENANKELESFTHSVSHDLRTPLRLMNKIAHLLIAENGPQLPADAMDKIQMILNSTQETGKLVEDLLAFSQVRREPMKKRRVDLRRLAREALAELRAEFESRDVEVVVDELPPCRADRALLKQVFLNLLANALKFTQPRERAEIRVGFSQSNGETVYFVHDNGVGFDETHSKSIFVVFHRLHRTQHFKGSGVGLALVKRIVERHDGRIWAEGEVDRGATFYFTLGE